MTDELQPVPIYERVMEIHDGHRAFVGLSSDVADKLAEVRRQVAACWRAYEDGLYADAGTTAREARDNAVVLSIALESLAMWSFDILADAKADQVNPRNEVL